MNHDPTLIKFIAPKIMSVNGYPSPCECTDKVTCSYCVQASLLGFDKKLKENDDTTKSIINTIRKKGIRPTARDMNVQPSVVQYWLHSGNVPFWAVKKMQSVRMTT